MTELAQKQWCIHPPQSAVTHCRCAVETLSETRIVQPPSRREGTRLQLEAALFGFAEPNGGSHDGNSKYFSTQDAGGGPMGVVDVYHRPFTSSHSQAIRRTPTRTASLPRLNANRRAARLSIQCGMRHERPALIGRRTGRGPVSATSVVSTGRFRAKFFDRLALRARVPRPP